MSIKPYELRNGNCKELIKQLADNSIDAIVTDPPYELGFMGKKWDATGIAYDAELWAECLRVLKPGGHLLAFSGSRTYHRMAVAIEDAGFEIRDQIMWLYGSGFPKSHDVSKAIDKMAGAEREVLGERNVPDQRGGKISSEATAFNGVQTRQINITAPATDAAKEWNGWGTALKPAHEPICVARKPLIGTVAENVLTHGTGAINVDACRVHGSKESYEYDIKRKGYKDGANHISTAQCDENGDRLGSILTRGFKARPHNTLQYTTQGRWPANLIHDGSAEVLAGFPESEPSGAAKNGRVNINGKNYAKETNIFGSGIGKQTGQLHNDRGSAARFFYCAKASKKDRDEGLEGFEERERPTMGNGIGGQPNQEIQNNRNHHPTVKPTDLMRYLCRLVTPPNGVILDPFLGSGSTGKAAMYEGFRFLGFEMEPQYIEIATARIEHAIEQKDKQKTEQENTLFGTNNE
jgi:DNA modification methylase